MERKPTLNRITGKVLILILFFLIFTISGCNIRPDKNISSTSHPQESNNGNAGEEIQNIEDEPNIIVKGDLTQEITSIGRETLSALREYKYEEIADLVHPDICLRFSPYPYMADSNLSFCPVELGENVYSNDILNWGYYDGSGEPIQLTFREYHDNFIYVADFSSAPIIGLNVEVSSGNSINNISDLYPDGVMIEYYFPEFEEKYGGMDWRSLRLVFINIEEGWYLAAIIHGEWTI